MFHSLHPVAFGQALKMVFDVNERITSQTDRNGVTVTNSYDNLGRLRTRTAPDGGVEAFGYTANYGGATSYTNQVFEVNCHNGRLGTQLAEPP